MRQSAITSGFLMLCISLLIPVSSFAIYQDVGDDPLPDSVAELLELKNKLFSDFRANADSQVTEKIPQVRRMVEIEGKIIKILQTGQAKSIQGIEQKPAELLATTQNVSIANAGYLAGLYAQVGDYQKSADARKHALHVAKDSLGESHWQTKEHELRFDQASWLANANEADRAKWLAAAALEG